MGFCYLQKCVGFDNFKAIGFLYIGGNKKINPKECVTGILEAVSKVNSQSSSLFRSILIPYSNALGEAKELLEILVDYMPQHDYLKEIILSTRDGKDFKKGSLDFVNLMSTLIDENKFCIAF